jgi:hypothetical protein
MAMAFNKNTAANQGVAGKNGSQNQIAGAANGMMPANKQYGKH